MVVQTEWIRTPKELREDGYNVLFYNISGFIKVCLIRKEGQNLARGIAICSYFDKYDKLEGAKQAFNRAVAALDTGIGSEPINTFGRKGKLKKRLSLANDFFFWKSEPNPYLKTAHEQELVERRLWRIEKRLQAKKK